MPLALKSECCSSKGRLILAFWPEAGEQARPERREQRVDLARKTERPKDGKEERQQQRKAGHHGKQEGRKNAHDSRFDKGIVSCEWGWSLCQQSTQNDKSHAHVRTYIHPHIHTCIHAHMHTHTHIQTYIDFLYMHTHVHKHMHSADFRVSSRCTILSIYLSIYLCLSVSKVCGCAQPQHKNSPYQITSKYTRNLCQLAQKHCSSSHDDMQQIATVIRVILAMAIPKQHRPAVPECE